MATPDSKPGSDKPGPSTGTGPTNPTPDTKPGSDKPGPSTGPGSGR